jgi:uncharacterized protein (DUF2236 family)
MWVHATLVDTGLKAYELVHPPIRAEMRERYYGECRLLGALFGISLEVQPPDWTSFAEYVRTTIASGDELAVGTTGREIARGVLSGGGKIPVPSWYRDLTALLTPERLREEFGLRLGTEERRRPERALRVIRRVYPALPARIRFVSPYQEALGRLAGRGRPDPLTRALNQLWIGRSSMPD